MGRILKTILLLIFHISILKSQCPDLPNNTTLNGSTTTSIEMCGTMPALFEVNDPNLPTGTIDWFSSTVSGFDPLTSGTLIGSSTINNSADPCDPGGCPTIEVIYISACSAEGPNEFMVIGSGSGFAVNDLSVTFDVNNVFGSAGNGNINNGGACGWSDGDLSLLTSCSSLISVGPGDHIPPSSTVIIQTSSFGTDIYDVSGLCGSSECIYVIKNSCDRSVGAFSNCGAGTGGGSTRNNEISLTCGCNDVLIYDILDPNFLNICNNIGDDGMHVFADLTYANNLCPLGPNLSSIPQFASSAMTDPFSHSFTDTECNTTQYIVGVLNSTQFNEDCCSQQITEEYEFDIACIEAELQGMGDLCPGECTEVSVLITGGVSPYNLNLSFTGLPIPFNNIMIPFIGFPLDDKITICFDNGGLIIDNTTFTLDIPAIAGGFSGSLTLNNIEDANGCAGTINGSSISISFNNSPTIVDPGPQEECDLGDGTAAFILSDLTNIINGGSGATVNYYSDAAGMTPITDPYITSGGSIFAQVMGTPCNSEIIEIQLSVVSNGDAGSVSLFCNDPIDGLAMDCTICDDDGVLGEEASLTIIFADATLNYDYVVRWIATSGPSSTINGSGIGTATFTFPIVETMTFFVESVTQDGDCTDFTNLGDMITINYSIAPDLDEPQNITDCGDVTLPAITGDMVPSNAAYYSASGGMGTMFNPGDMITSSTTLFLYGGIENCDEEFEFEIIIEDEAMIDDPADVVTCGVYALPEITGTNVGNASYFTEINGGGNIVTVGTIISTTVELFLFDPNCGGNQPTLDITITPGPVIQNNTDTIVCEMYIVEPIVGIDLSGNEAYFDTIDGNGIMINVGDTITVDSILFIYDNTAGCEVEIPIFIDIQEPAFPGLDTAIIVCEGDPALVNINEQLGGDLPDITGTWLDINNTGLLSDSTQVDFSSLPIGTYLFEYQILDSICVDTHSVLTVNVIGTPNAGSDASITLCSDTTGVDILALLGAPDTGGTLYDESNMVSSLDPTNADFDASTVGSSVFTYVVGIASSSCGADSSTFTVIVEGSVSAGDDFTTGACAGVVVDLTTLLNNNSGVGVFGESTMSGGLMGNAFDTDMVADGMYDILHILPGSGPCPPDTAILSINVTDAANAGDEANDILCGDTSISLSDYVNGDDGGIFYFNNSSLPNGDIIYTSEVGTFSYLYIVGDGIDCPFDSAEINIIRNIEPAIFLDISFTELCDEDCTTVSFNAANNGGQDVLLYYHVESNMGESVSGTQPIGDLMPITEITYCIGVGDLTNNELQPGTEYTFTIDSISIDNFSCTFIYDESVVFNTNVEEVVDLTGTYCLDAVVPVGNDFYDMVTFEGTTTIPNGSASGCDSVINVSFIFTDQAEGDFEAILCEGDSITINGVQYKTDISDEFLIPDGSVNGCDSLVKFDIVFTESTTEDYPATLCAGDTLTINGELFFVGMESSSQTLVGMNSMGCDSIVEVTIEVDDPVFEDFTGDFCSSFSIDINGETYDINNDSGIEIFNNMAVNGCDSVVTIALTFNADVIDSTLNISTCDNDFSLIIGGETFDITNTIGDVTLSSSDPSQCDTLVSVELLFGELGLDYIEEGGGCTASSTGVITLESTTGDLPLNLLYNGNNAIAFVLPYEIELPVGSGEISVTDDSGCESIIQYELFPGGGEEFDISENQGQISVTGNDIDSIVWSPTDGLSCIDCLDPIAQPEQSTTYTAMVFFDDSCSVDLEIEVLVIDNLPDYVLPSVFSPNGDNTNDNFIVTITNGAIGIPQSMLIYDRWGNRVFEGFGNDLVTIGWDGRLNGDDVIPGVYVYVFTVLEEDKIVTIYGDVTVVR